MIELQRNLYVLRRWWWLLVAAALIGGVLAYGLTKLLVHQQYASTATLSMAPPPQGPNGLLVTTLSASADASLVATAQTAGAAVQMLSPADRSKVASDKLTSSIQAVPSTDNQLLFIQVRWPDQALSPRLANVVVQAFINQEQARLERKYSIIHRDLSQEEGHLKGLLQSARAGGNANSWLQAQYADAASRIYQQDAEARIQASTQEASLQLAVPASNVTKVGPKPGINGVLGAALAFLLALVIAYLMTGSYGEAEESEAPRPVLSSVAE